MRIAKIVISHELFKQGIPKELLVGMFDLLPAGTKLTGIWDAHSRMVTEFTFTSPAFKDIPPPAAAPEITPWFKEDVDQFGRTAYCERIDFHDVLENTPVTIPIPAPTEPYTYKVYRPVPGDQWVDDKSVSSPEPEKKTTPTVSVAECEHIFKSYSVPFAKPVLICFNCGHKERT